MSTRVNSARLAWVVTACLALSVTFFAPRLWLMRTPVPGSFQWDRAHTFLLQCAEPLRRDIEPAMQWRLLPPLVAHFLHLPGLTPLALPWLGILVTTTYTAVLCRRRLDDWRFVAGGTLLFATTSAVLVPVGWLGMNDAWVWLGLFAVAFGRSRWALPIACLLAPWVDERFVIGFPLAWLVGKAERAEAWRGSDLRHCLWLLPYAVVRLALELRDPVAAAATRGFLGSHLSDATRLVPIAPLGWWMGLRAAWVPLIYAGWIAAPGSRLRGGALVIATAGVSLVLAADISRSIAILMPAVLLGCFLHARRAPEQAPRALLILGLINLALPAAHIVHLKIDPIHPLPIEILRLFRLP